jgi:hypothetical protein
MQKQWSSRQQYCLSQMGVDLSYLYPDTSILEEQVLYDTKKVESLDKHPKQLNQSNLTDRNVDITASSIQDRTTSVEVQKNSLNKLEPPPPTPILGEQGTNNEEREEVASATLTMLKQRKSQQVIYVLGRQKQFSELLLGRQLIADLSLYLCGDINAFNYLSFLDRELPEVLNEILDNERAQLDKKQVFIFPQGDEQYQKIIQIIEGDEQLSAYLKNHQLILPASLATLISDSKAKKTLLNSLSV